MHNDTPDAAPRRDFLSRLAAGTVALAATSLIPERAEALADSVAAPGAWDETWLDKIKGKHRQMYDATEINQGFPLAWARVFIMSNMEAYKLPESEITAVVVCRHSGIPFVFQDSIWSKYNFGKEFNVIDPATKQPSTRNIYYHSKPGDLLLPDMSVDKLQASGAIFVVCNVALTIYSQNLGAKVGVAADKAKDEWTAGLVPGVTIVPSGVLAVNRAQEKGCTYCFAG